MNNQKHIIRQQTITIEMAKGDSVTAMQDRVKQLYYNNILPRLDVLFSGLSTNEAIIRINKLEVDLGSIGKDTLEQDLVEKTINSIEKQLKEKLQFDVKAEDNVSIVPAHQSVIDEFVYFLLHGYFPWWSQNKTISLLENGLINGTNMSAGLVEKLNNLLTESSAINRLVFQFSDRFLSFLVPYYVPHFAAKDTLDIIQSSFTNISFVQTRVTLRDYFWQVALANLSLSANDLQVKVLLAVCKHAATAQNTSVDAMLRLVDTTKLSSIVQDRLKKIREDADAIKGSANDLYNDSLEKDKTSPEKETRPTNEERMADSNNAETSVPVTNKSFNDVSNDEQAATKAKQQPSTLANQNNNVTSKAVITDEPIYLELAGLVILHSFLIPFFDTLRLTENKRFCSAEAMRKAVQLTGYLATGETYIEEAFLVLPKLLCGMELTDPVEKEIVVSEEEKKEAEALLQQVISHWAALKTTSADGLRNTFLKREGKLTKGGLGWQLDVEHKTWDVLLARLPWGFSLIKLPWMKEMLFVNWN